jgi:hypothetical protein
LDTPNATVPPQAHTTSFDVRQYIKGWPITNIGGKTLTVGTNGVNIA